ncbi:MAG: hypothetical protein GF364_02770 [Candidatus Lokiarchaeota archaeon]|nr:hypothetical protein [Candidatus Lokiarchaeota archaeon]
MQTNNEKQPTLIKHPIILDTDIGNDIDDTWALGYALKCPELDIKLITTATGDTEYRARIVAKFLESVGRTDIPIGMGKPDKWKGLRPQKKWIKHYNIQQYPGAIEENGVNAIIKTVSAFEHSNKRPKIVAIGPLNNIADLLSKKPDIIHESEFIGMHGSIRYGYGAQKGNMPEYNIVHNIEASKQVFSSKWKKTITPLDTCGDIILEGKNYEKLLESDDRIVQNILENYRIWAKRKNKRSSVLFDTVAIYLAYSDKLLRMEQLKLKVNDSGCTIIDPEDGQIVNVATSWKDKNQFKKMLVDRLTSQ